MRLLWISGIDGFCHRYEVLHRVEQARLLGASSVVRHFTDARLEHDVARADFVLAYRTPDTPLVQTVLARARRRGTPILGTIDDLIFVPDEASLPPLDHLDASARALWLDGVRRYRAVLESCDGFLAPTEPLLDIARGLGWRAWLHRDALAAGELALGDAARRRAQSTGRARGEQDVVLGYFSGTPTHDRDFATITTVLAGLLAAHPTARLLLVGPLTLDAELETFADRIRRRPRVPWTALPELIASVDVNLAPLELESRFAAAKGEVKYLEAAAVGVPTIASATAAFRHAIRDRRNGRLAGAPEEWRSALDELLADPEQRRALGVAAREDVELRFAPALRARELAEILGAVTSTRRDAPAAGAPLGAKISGATARVALEPDACPDLELLPGTLTSPPVGAGARLSQTFRVRVPGLARLDLFPITYGQALAHHLRLEIVDARGGVALRRRRRAAHAPDRAWWSVTVPSGRLECDRSYRLELTVEETSVAAALSFALAASDAAPGGERTEAAMLDGAALGAALALRTFGAWQPAARGSSDPTPRRGLLDDATTLTGAILEQARADRERERLVFAAADGGEQRFTSRALLARAAAIRAVLERHGLRPGDALVLILPTGPELVAAYFAALLAGAVPALASPPMQRVAAPEVHRRLVAGIVADAAARLAYCDASTAAALAPDGDLFHGARIVRPVDVDVAATAGPAAPCAAAPDGIATIQYSSGSTGAPKGVRLSHRAILNNLRAVRDALGLSAHDVSVNWIPLYHDMGLIDAFLLPLLCGCDTVLIPTADFIREPRRWLQALDRHHGTISWAPNFAYALCVQRVTERDVAGLDLSRWRLALNAAEPVLPETIAAFATRFAACGFRPEAMTPAWGLAENVTIATAHPAALPPRVEWIDRGIAASAARAVPVAAAGAGFACVAVGRPLPGCALQIRDGDRVLAAREIGDVWLHSDSLFTGYGDDGRDAPPSTPAGWLATGDRGYVADGDLFFVARAKDVIVVAGEKHAPHDVESAINEVPGVRPGCAIAFGVRDAERGTEALCAVVETRLTEQAEQAALARAIRAHVSRVTGLALRHLKLVPPGGVGKTTSGKLARSATRAHYARELA